MSEPFLGQLSLVGFNFAPVGWAARPRPDPAHLAVRALFSLLGTYYGGNGTATSSFPTCRATSPSATGRAPASAITSSGRRAARQTVTLLASETPVHTHTPPQRAW